MFSTSGISIHKNRQLQRKKFKVTLSKYRVLAVSCMLISKNSISFFWRATKGRSPVDQILGIGIIAIAFGLICFKLWPEWLKITAKYVVQYTIYPFVLFVLALGFLRPILFGLTWLFTNGKVRFWLFPNLFADCGLIESFKPLYSIKYSKTKHKKLE